MKLRCAILDDYQGVAMSIVDWSAISPFVETKVSRQHFFTEEETANAIADCEIVVIMRERTPFSATMFARLPKLKLLITTGMRNAAVDMEAAASNGVVVCGTGGSTSPPVELTWALILGLARHLVQENTAMRTNGPWQSTIGTDLSGKTLGILGLGKIGSHVARIGKAFGMDVIAWSQNLTDEHARSVGARLASAKEELLESSDFATIHLVLSPRTRDLIGAAELKRMRSSAFLINTSRAAIVNQSALKEALRNNELAGAGLDVFDLEPLPEDDLLRSLPNVLTLPHMGYVTQGNYTMFYRGAIEDIQAFLAGAPIRRLN